MTDEEINFSDCPEITSEKFAKAVVRQGLPIEKNKVQVTLRIDSDVLAWFKSHGRGYQTQINSLLRAHMEAHDLVTKQQHKMISVIAATQCTGAIVSYLNFQTDLPKGLANK
jgi:uncharacterized protein (DUF4415 family)